MKLGPEQNVQMPIMSPPTKRKRATNKERK